MNNFAWRIGKLQKSVILGLLCCSLFAVACGGGGGGGGGSSADRVEGFNPEQSAARNWNEALLSAIRRDFARPTVHARNLFHSSALMYDLWAVYDQTAEPYFLGKEVAGFSCPLSSEQRTALQAAALDLGAARSEAISFGMFRLLNYRFSESPGAGESGQIFADLLSAQGYDPSEESTDFSDSSPAALGRYLADCIIAFGQQDGSNELNNFANRFYQPVNEPLAPAVTGSFGLIDPNRWQPLRLDVSIDQSGNQTGSQQPFLGAEWGNVEPFALRESACPVYPRDGGSYRVCYDPGAPALLRGAGAMPAEYQWTHALVALWSAHLDPNDGVLWDISPGSIGNTADLPRSIPAMRDFYDALDGGAADFGHAVNPATGQPYAPNVVPRGDYTRVLAEFWADGPASETPPGHWFTIANEAVNDHPLFERRYRGSGPVLDPLEWDVKLYFMLGGAVHDAAIAAWGAKGWYDYLRPISAIRYMASRGQGSEPTFSSYNPEGIPLVDGRIEIVFPGDPLEGLNQQNIGRIKVFAWRGPDFIDDPEQDTAGVGWILAEDWWPYQQPTFVTPPFAGYVSGHSTFSRAAAEVLTYITGDPFFPGGLGEFVAPANEFLEFERGPSVEVRLQWATYRDASDQTSLSRIWGGIHPPVDDIPGRFIGIEVAGGAAALADSYFSGAPLP